MLKGSREVDLLTEFHSTVELKQRQTSGIMKCPAMSRESRRFSRASFLRSEKGTWDPLRKPPRPSLIAGDATYPCMQDFAKYRLGNLRPSFAVNG
ncbi:hypothetical protein CLAIMM_02894 [Cladophialophora immunda]|nr:hypothetical protein CLAIMM_02894 [Cladophialophora immunda]